MTTDRMRMSVRVNGTRREVDVPVHHTLLDMLRDDIGLTGTKECCAEGECGACTVLLDGHAVNSCLVLAVEAADRDVATVEGLADGDRLDRVQDAFLATGGVQCGFCIPGMVMSAEYLLARIPRPTAAEIREGLSGNLCRCGGYNQICEAVGVAAESAGGRPVTRPDPIGRSERRIGGTERVNGAQRYVADIALEGVQHVRLVHLDVARARIDRIDTAAAERVPGVIAVVTAQQLPQPVPRFGPGYADRPLLAVDETTYHGEPVAAVVAETRDAADEAARLVRVEHQALPAVLTVAQALDPASPLVRNPQLRAADDEFRATNILTEWRFGWGDVEGATAEHVVERRYTAASTTHFAIEPHGFMAAPDGDGVAIWSSIQHPYVLQRLVAETLGMPLSRVRVFAPDPGGGFGGKQHAKFEPLLALLALRTGRPVRLILTLEETFQAVRSPTFEIADPHGLRARRDHRLPGHRQRRTARGVRGHRPPRGLEEQLPGLWAVPRPARADPRARTPLEHATGHRTARLRKPADGVGLRIADGRGCASAGHGPIGDPAPQPGATWRGDRARRGRHAGRWRVGAGRASRRRRHRLGNADPEGTGPGHRAGNQVVRDHRGLVCNRSVAA